MCSGPWSVEGSQGSLSFSITLLFILWVPFRTPTCSTCEQKYFNFCRYVQSAELLEHKLQPGKGISCLCRVCLPSSLYLNDTSVYKHQFGAVFAQYDETCQTLLPVLFFFFFGRRENTIRLVRWATGIFFFFLNSKTMLVGSFICDLGNLAHSADEQWFYLITVCSFEPQMFLQRKRV